MGYWTVQLMHQKIVNYDGSYFYIGGDVRDGRDWFDGKISSLRIYTDALSDDRVMGGI